MTAMSAWQIARQRDFTGGETQADLPELVARNQLLRMENCIISPQGQITESWQMDKPLFTNVVGGIVVVPIPGSRLYTVYAASGNNIISFTFDPESNEAHDLADPMGHPGYVLREHGNPVTITGISHGTPFLGKNYCCATSNLELDEGLSASVDSLAFGTVQTRYSAQQAVTITNDTLAPVTITGVAVSGANASSFGHSAAMPVTLAAGNTYTFNVIFNPVEVGSYAASVRVPSALNTIDIPITGQSETLVAINMPILSYGSKFNGSTWRLPVNIVNSGPRTAAITSIDIEVLSGTSTYAAHYIHEGVPGGTFANLVYPFAIAPNATTTVYIDCTFQNGATSAKVTVNTDAGTAEFTVTGAGHS